jgi:hypothetical protein
LALESQQREHFLALATPEKVEQGVTDGMFEKESESFGLLWGEAGRAWVWMDQCTCLDASDRIKGKCVLYSDV